MLKNRCSLALGAVLALSLAACGGDEPTATAKAMGAINAPKMAQIAAAVSSQSMGENKACGNKAASRFEDIGGGSIKDNQTGLVWAQADNGSDISWGNAIRYCAEQDASLPTVEEFEVSLTTPAL